MTNKKMTIVSQKVSKAIEQDLLRILVEIYDHISTKDEVKRSIERPVMQQIKLSEMDNFLQGRRHFYQLRTFLLASPNPTLEKRFGQCLNSL